MTEMEQLLSILLNKSGLDKEAVLSKIEEKKESLGHLVNDEVALRLVARELGVSLSEEGNSKPVIRVEDLVPNMNNVSLSVVVEEVMEPKDFTRKDGTPGKVARVTVSDETGRATLVLWDEKADYASRVREGDRIEILSAYTRKGLSGDLEIQAGNRCRIEIPREDAGGEGEGGAAKGGITGSAGARGGSGGRTATGTRTGAATVMAAAVENGGGGLGAGTDHYAGEIIDSGRIVRVYDPIEFKRRDGTPGRAASFIMGDGEKRIRVLVWNPTDDFVAGMREGAAVRLAGGAVKPDLQGRPEIHVNDEALVDIDLEDVDPDAARIETRRLWDLQPDLSDFAVEGFVEGDFSVETTSSGKNYARVLLRDGECCLPVVFWNEKALQVKRVARPGSILRVEGCYSKAGRYGFEIHVQRWSRLITK